MVQAEGDRLGCACPACGARCHACMGTKTLVPRDRLKTLAEDPRFRQYMEDDPIEPM